MRPLVTRPKLLIPQQFKLLLRLLQLLLKQQSIFLEAYKMVLHVLAPGIEYRLTDCFAH